MLENYWPTGENEKNKKRYALTSVEAADFQTHKHGYYERLVKGRLAGVQGFGANYGFPFGGAAQTC